MGAKKTAGDEVEGGKRQSTAKSLKTLLLMYAPPFVGWVLVGVVALASWGIWGRSYTGRPLFAVGAVVATLGLARFAMHLAATRGAAVRWLAASTIAAAGLWVAAVVIFGPLARPLPDLYVFGLVVCAFWSVRRALLSTKGEATVVDGQAAKLLEVLDGAKLGRPKAKETSLGTTIVEVALEADRGRQTASDLQAKAEDLGNVMKLRPGAVTMQRDQADGAKVIVQVAPVDALATPRLWAGPDQPGASIGNPIRLGPYLDGLDATITLPGDEKKRRNLAHIIAQGVTGAGKSEGVRNLMTSVLCRTEVCVIGSDPVKGLQTLGAFVETGALELVALDLPRSRAMLAAVRRAIPARGAYLGRRGFKQWEPGCGLALLVVWLEEANWATQTKVLEQVAAEARSVGIMLVVSQQRASHTKTDTDLRANLRGAWCFGVADAVDATMVLPDSVVDDGAHPELWGNTRPGYSYLVHPSIPEECWTKILRPELAEDDAIRAALLKWAHVRSPMDEVTREAFGKTYDEIKQAMAGYDVGLPVVDAEVVAEEPARRSTSTTVDRAPESGELLDDDELGGFDDGDEDDAADADPQADDDDLPPLGEPVEPDMHVDPAAEIGPPPASVAGFRFGPPKPRRLDTAEARAVVQQHLRSLICQSRTQTTSADVAKMKPATGRSNEWVRKELHRLCTDAAAGEIALELDEDAEQPGVFTILAPELAGVAS